MSRFAQVNSTNRKKSPHWLTADPSPPTSAPVFALSESNPEIADPPPPAKPRRHRRAIGRPACEMAQAIDESRRELLAHGSAMLACLDTFREELHRYSFAAEQHAYGTWMAFAGLRDLCTQRAKQAADAGFDERAIAETVALMREGSNYRPTCEAAQAHVRSIRMLAESLRAVAGALRDVIVHFRNETSRG